MDDKAAINYLKGIIVNSVHKAKSGHPGGALSSIDFAYILFTEYLRFDPKDPDWFGRDRFVLSAGHESMLLYSFLFAIGWLGKDDLLNFRQFGSKTPGHPESHMTPGVECTTGPLGQGAAMSVGFSIASQHMTAQLGSSLFLNNIYSLLGDGCMQEEVVSGAASLAGHLKLDNLIWYYDKNNQQISGSIDRAVSCDYKKVFEGFGWFVLEIDGHNHAEIREALNLARKEDKRPTLIIGSTTMAKGVATMEGSHKTHGAPLPNDERLKTLEKLGVPADEDLHWPDEVKDYFQTSFPQKSQEANNWRESLEQILSKNSDFKEKYSRYFSTSIEELLPGYLRWESGTKLATRNAFGDLIEKWASYLPQLVGGSADLEPSNMTEGFAKKVGDFSPLTQTGRNFAFGVREFSMSAICNGLSLYGGLIPFDATFLTFSDYSRAALRLGAIQKARVIHEFTHDSFYLGEDGPTHQPIEHLMSLRGIPDLYVFRPCDANETEVLLRKALNLTAPSCICLSRQKLPILEIEREALNQSSKGAWIVHGRKGSAEVIIFSSGAEVHLALEVARKLEEEMNLNDKVKVVALSCWELFSEQEDSYKNFILETSCKKRISIEAGSTLGWERFVGLDGLKVGIDHYGASAPASDLEEAFGFTKEKIMQQVKDHFSF